jgi:type II secretory pathway predicted ATPase ExeA
MESHETKSHPAILALVSHQDLRCSDATWSTLKSGTYPGNVEPWLEKAEAALRLLEDEAAGQPAGSELLELSDAKAVIRGVRECAVEERNRLVAFLADTGGGKSRLAKMLRARLGETVVIVEATEAWRDNYLAAICACLAALGETDIAATVRKAETQLVASLARSPRVLVVDEAHYSGRAALNLLKLILNKSQTRVVMLAMPKLWDDMQKAAWAECQQLRNRTFAKVALRQVGDADCRLFLAARLPGYDGLNGDEKEVVRLCREAANRFGLFNTLDAICREAAREHGSGVEQIAAAIARVETLRS